MKSSRLFYFTVASVFIAGAAKVFSQSTVSDLKNALVESSKFNGSPVVVTEFRGNSPDSLKKFSVAEENPAAEQNADASVQTEIPQNEEVPVSE